MIPVYPIILATTATPFCSAFHPSQTIFRHNYYPSKPTSSSEHSIFCAQSSAVSFDFAATEIDGRSLLVDTRQGDLMQKVDIFIDKLEGLSTFCNSYNAKAREILNKVDRDHKNDVNWADETSLPFEWDDGSSSDGKTSGRDTYPIEHDEILSYNDVALDQLVTKGDEKHRVAIRTKQSTPLLQHHEILCLKEAVELYWEGLSSYKIEESPQSNRNSTGSNHSSAKSRFTYQRRGNSEAHLSDVVKFSHSQEKTQVTSLVNDLLLNRVYPWIRDAYLSKETTIRPKDWELYVYDSLFIRYNATEANIDAVIGERVGAGQPLHRDLGYVSVNIMLNSQREFEGGGTFFENQLRSLISEDGVPELFDEAAVDVLPLKPLGVGHALVHYSSDRHAGAATFGGVRDILVIFVAAAARNENEKDGSQSTVTTGRAPTWERAARLKSTSRGNCSKCSSIVDHLACRMLHHRLAIGHVPNDGEAWHYLGMAMLEFYEVLQYPDIGNSNPDSIEGEDVLELSIECFNKATRHTPCDGRLYNNLGIALERLSECRRESDERIKRAYKTSFVIHSVCEKIGCDVGADFERTILNYGLHLSKQDDFEGAIRILSQIESRAASSNKNSELTSGSMHANDSRQKIIQDAKGLLSFCASQIAK
mmetsp:Transcript_14166/g.27039  ORF Transcript_14166/g.27039 Transcript_14166/m.27039 type:complete len:649 (+) Transcript_14166:2-1948(+)